MPRKKNEPLQYNFGQNVEKLLLLCCLNRDICSRCLQITYIFLKFNGARAKRETKKESNI